MYRSLQYHVTNADGVTFKVHWPGLALRSYYKQHWRWQLLLSAVIFGGAIVGSREPALAQSRIVPDRTLGAERSVVAPDPGGLPIEVIAGGALRGANLFHSFLEFNVSVGRGAFFFSPSASIHNILARVTGANPSEIFGTLRTYGYSRPNLFLINPNGIIFGPNASLDVGGSFVATTANAVQLGGRGLFSASEPNSSQLLDINPSAFLFNALLHGAIVNRSTASTTLFGTPTSGLEVPNGQSLLLLGGDVKLDGGNLSAPGGRVELGGLAGAGTVELNVNGSNLSLSFPAGVPRADVALTEGARVAVSAGGGGSIGINARNLDMSGESELAAGIVTDSGSINNRAGNIEIDATDQVTLDGTGLTDSPTSITNQVLGVGTAGNIIINTGNLNLIGGAEIGSVTSGRGDAGSVTIRVRDTVSLSGIDSLLFSGTNPSSVGNGSDMTIQTRSLSLSNGAQILTSSSGEGNAGNIQVNATDFVSIKSGSTLQTDIFGQGKAGNVTIAGRDGMLPSVSIDGVGADGSSSEISSSVDPSGVGKGGDINIQARSLSLTNGAQLEANTYGRGDAGSLTLAVRDAISFDGVGSKKQSSGALTTVEVGGAGNGGDINITSGSLFITNGAQINASTFGEGHAGSVNIAVRDAISFDGVGSQGQDNGTLSIVGPGAVGNGSDINIAANSLSLTNGAQIQTGISGPFAQLPGGRGKSGSVNINAGNITMAGVGKFNNPSGIFTSVDLGSVGDAGNISVRTGALSLTEGAELATSTSGQGNAGSVSVRATNVSLSNSTVTSAVQSGGVGNGGDIVLETRSLSLTDGSQLIGAVNGKKDNRPGGRGQGGNIRVSAIDSVNLAGIGPEGFSSGFFSSTGEGANGGAGNITVNSRALRIADGAVVNARTLNSSNGGNIMINTNNLEAVNGGQVLTTTSNRGRAGSIAVNAADSVTLRGSASTFVARPTQSGRVVTNPGAASGLYASTNTNSTGQGGDVRIATGQLQVLDGAQVAVNSSGSGNAGNLEATARSLKLDRGQLTAETATGDGGNIKLQVQDLLLLRHKSLISTSAGTASAGGDGGNITIDTPFIVAVPKENSDIRANAFTGSGGRVDITARGLFGIQFRPQDTPLSDITASSTFGVNGVVSINTPGIDPSRGITDSPVQPADATRQIAQNCPAGGSQVARGSEFVVTGRGGLPPTPRETLSGDTVLEDWGTRTLAVASSPRGDMPSVKQSYPEGERSHISTTPNIASAPTSPLPVPLVEAQGWVYGPKGEVILTAAPTGTHHDSQLTSARCHISSHD